MDKLSKVQRDKMSMTIQHATGFVISAAAADDIIFALLRDDFVKCRKIEHPKPQPFVL